MSRTGQPVGPLRPDPLARLTIVDALRAGPAMAALPVLILSAARAALDPHRRTLAASGCIILYKPVLLDALRLHVARCLQGAEFPHPG